MSFDYQKWHQEIVSLMDEIEDGGQLLYCRKEKLEKLYCLAEDGNEILIAHFDRNLPESLKQPCTKEYFLALQKDLRRADKIYLDTAEWRSWENTLGPDSPCFQMEIHPPKGEQNEL